jgi:amino acid adenylation domain-containing protein
MAIEGFPLSPQQKRLWSLQHSDQGSPYHVRCVVLIEGNLDPDLLIAAMEDIWDRHEILRTAFQCLAGTTIPVQVITDGSELTNGTATSDIGALSVDRYDFTGCESSQQPSRIAALADEASALPFDFARGQLSHLSLVALSPARHALLINLSALCADIASLRNLVREIGLAYSARLAGENPAGEPSQYADLAEWQNGLLESEDTTAGRAYWRGIDYTLLTLKPASEGRTSSRRIFKPALLCSTIDLDGLATIGALTHEYDVSPSELLLTCWQTLLWRLGRASAFIVATACDGRNYEGLQDALGPFSKYLPLQCQLDEKLQFSTLLQQVSESAREAREWQEYFSWEEFASSDGSIEAPFLAASFDFQEGHTICSAANLTFSISQQYSCTDRFELKLSCVQSEGHLEVEFHYDSSVFHEQDIKRLNDQFHRLLESAAGNPEAAIGDLEILNHAQRRQLLVEFNATADYPKNKCVHQLFEEQVERTPAKVALVFERQGLTYAELNARANQVAHHLRTLGVEPGVLVAICMERCLEMVVGLLGVLKAGGSYVPIDPFAPKERQAFMLEDTGATILLTQQHLATLIPERAMHTLCLDSGWDAIAQNGVADPINLATSKDAAYVIYTSGSTGQPKGVIVEHCGLSNAVNWIIETLELSSADSCFLKTPITFDAAGRELFPTLLTGGVLVIAEPGREGDCQYIAAMMRSKGISILHCVPSLLRLIIEEPAFDDTSKLRAVMCGGEPLSAPLAVGFQCRSNAKLYNVYGPTEASIDTTFWLCDRVDAQSSIPIGRPIPNSKLYVLDDLLRLLPIGVAGHLHIGGVGLARGYLNRADLTAEKFIPNPFSQEPGARLYRTGDLARYLPDGNLEFLGRADHQVKIRGYRIELEEIESVLGQHPAVREAVVIAQEEAPGDKRLVAYLVNAPGHQPTASDLRGFLQEKLPAYMVPAVFVPLESLPLLSNGKVDRRALPEPGRTRPDFRKAFVAPRDALELKLTHLWEDVLGVRPIGVRDNFFELGGHSLAAVRLFALIEHRMGRKLPLATVFQGATVEHLAAIFRQSAKPAGQSSLVAIQPAGDLRPLFLIHPAGGHVFPYVQLAQSLGLNQPCYGLQARGLEEGQVPHTRIEEMAAYYIDALQSVQAEGPYRLGGWSAGGVVAFEMAQQLHARGHKVNLLALLDARIPSSEEDFADEDFEATLLADFIRYFGLSMNSQESLARLPKDELLTRVLEQAKLAGLVPPDVQASQAHPFIELCKADFRATQSYVPQRYPGRITLFKASQELAEISSDPTLGWGKLAAGGAEVHVVPGNHASMVYKPHVEVLARELNICLDQVRLTEKHILKDDKAIERSRKAAK